MDLERAIELSLDEQAKAAEAHRKLEEQQAKSSEKHGREMGQIRGMLSRAVKLGVQEARAERKRRQKIEEDVAELRASQALTEQKRSEERRAGQGGTKGGWQPQES